MGYNILSLAIDEGKLADRNGVQEALAEVYDGGTHRFRVELEPGSGTIIRFQVIEGRPTGLEWREISFARVP